jgi:hypothetical protein
MQPASNSVYNNRCRVPAATVELLEEKGIKVIIAE